MNENGHIYLRELDPSGDSSLAKIAKRIAPASKVLDIGTGPGILGKYLKEEKGCIVDGVDFHPVQVEMARPHYRQIHVADLETARLSKLFPKGGYDFIVCADILEHLKDPGFILSQLAAMLSPVGRMLFSIPNVAYSGLVADLLAGRFEYRKEGLLDETHLRFFTRSSMLNLLERHGLVASHVDTVTLGLDKSEFSTRHPGAFPPAIYRHLFAGADALTYQFVVEALPEVEGVAGSHASLPVEVRPEICFSCGIRWRDSQGVAQDAQQFAILGKSHQKVSFALPEKPLSSLSLIPADRPGFLAFHGIKLYGAEGDCIWAWNGDMGVLESLRVEGMVFAHAWFGGFRVVALVTDEYPVMDLNIPAEILAQTTGRLEVELSWPMSSDYLAIAQRFLNAEENSEGEDKDAYLLARLAAIHEQQITLQSQHIALHEQFSGLQGHAVRLEEERKQLITHITNLQGMLESAAQDAAALRGELHAMRESRSWRYTRPIARFLARLSGQHE